MANQRSLYLNDNWDITLDTSGDLATTKGLYCDAQNVANAIRLFTHDAYIAQDEGIPHFGLELGKRPALSSVRNIYRQTAKAVENIADATIENLYIDSARNLKGKIIATTDNGQKVAVEI